MYIYVYMYVYIHIYPYTYICIYICLSHVTSVISLPISLSLTCTQLSYTHDVHTENGGKLDEYASIHIYVCICIDKCVHITSKHTRKQGQV